MASDKRGRRRANLAADERDNRAAVDQLLKITKAELAKLKRKLKSKTRSPQRNVKAGDAWAVRRLELMKTHLSAYTRAKRAENGDR